MSLLRRIEACITHAMQQMEEEREWQATDTRRLATSCKQVFLEWAHEKRRALKEPT